MLHWTPYWRPTNNFCSMTSIKNASIEDLAIIYNKANNADNESTVMKVIDEIYTRGYNIHEFDQYLEN